MGVKGLWKLIQERAPGCVEKVAAKTLRGQTLALDASFVITQYRTAIKEPLARSHLHAVITKTVSLLRNGVTPIFVFDGPSPEEKRACVEARLLRGPAPVPTREEAEECQCVLDLIGVAWVASPGEADWVCSAMTLRGEADSVLSEDLDMFAHGAKSVIRCWNYRGGVRVQTADLLQALRLTQEAFVDLCLLLGTDYATTVAGIGPKRAWDAVRSGQRPEDLEDSPRWQGGRRQFGIGATLEYTIHRPVPVPDSWPGLWNSLGLPPNRRASIEAVLLAALGDAPRP